MEKAQTPYTLELMYTKCLSISTYYIESEGQAVLIDPIRDIDTYLARLRTDKAKLKYVMLTHIHADFISGHVDLARQTGATIVYGPSAKTNFKIKVAKDGEIFKLGGVAIEWLHTPGHTMESSSMVLRD